MGLTRTLIGYWMIGIPLMVICAYALGWGGWGVWTGLCAGFGTTALLLARRYFHKAAFSEGGGARTQ